MNLEKRYTITAFTENTPGVLYRIADLFLRRKINIESLTVSETEKEGMSRFTIVVKTGYSNIEKIMKQLYRIIEVVKVYESEDNALIFKEIAFIKVSTKNANTRREVADVVSIAKGQIVYVGQEFAVIEKTGSEEEIDDLLGLLRRYGIKEFVRSGRIAILKEVGIKQEIRAK